MYGTLYNEYDDLQFDPEEKITEFNYENYIPQPLLKQTDTKTESFKNMVKFMNLESKTAYEQHKANQEEFRQLMPIISTLTEEETEIFIHMMQNKNRNLDNSVRRSQLLIDNDCDDEYKKKLAKLSEEENFALKNRWMHQKKTMAYADKKRMPIDRSKVVDLLRH